eukprot:CAMPEP_0178372122 /NCGR_PEP_ID=MMETSP0689_2-20121128/1187_1 /TAXON_ID=160604 /ORGANISM="Amphidinium massartii, Strain CS-259" /LENGTH=330 /DNA_ID=CAMNT_0019992029 /DNA_START=38 /DNA_END=1027 /DNA_ORIENTATION=+
MSVAGCGHLCFVVVWLVIVCFFVVVMHFCPQFSVRDYVIERHSKNVSAGLKGEGRGVVLWSYGRSGSTFFADNWQGFTGDRFCNNWKESWTPSLARTHPLNLEGLRGCMAKNEYFMHVKPEHLDGQNSFNPRPAWLHEEYWTVHPDVFRTPKQFFHGCAETGYSVVIAHVRRNILHQELSQFEHQCSIDAGFDENHLVYLPECIARKAQVRFCMSTSLAEDWDRRVTTWVDGIQAAYNEGLTVVFSDYASMTTDPCELMQRVQTVLSRAVHHRCKVNMTKRNGLPHPHLTRLDRIGLEAEKCLIRQIKSAANPDLYMWMLNDSAAKDLSW